MNITNAKDCIIGALAWSYGNAFCYLPVPTDPTLEKPCGDGRLVLGEAGPYCRFPLERMGRSNLPAAENRSDKKTFGISFGVIFGVALLITLITLCCYRWGKSGQDGTNPEGNAGKVVREVV
jgi:hypothetical protein